ncbi:hypothetical protein Tco_0614669 [Tanacetum coccineum]
MTADELCKILDMELKDDWLMKRKVRDLPNCFVEDEKNFQKSSSVKSFFSCPWEHKTLSRYFDPSSFNVFQTVPYKSMERMKKQQQNRKGDS